MHEVLLFPATDDTSSHVDEPEGSILSAIIEGLPPVIPKDKGTTLRMATVTLSELWTVSMLLSLCLIGFL